MAQRVAIALALAGKPSLLDRRRADDGARRHDPGRDPRSAARPHRRTRDVDHPRHARPRRRRRHLRRRLGHVRRRDRRDRIGPRRADAARAPVHDGAAGRRSARDPRSRRHDEAGVDPGPGAAARFVDERMPLRSALPVREGRMPRDRAARTPRGGRAAPCAACAATRCGAARKSGDCPSRREDDDDRHRRARRVGCRRDRAAARGAQSRRPLRQEGPAPRSTTCRSPSRAARPSAWSASPDPGKTTIGRAILGLQPVTSGQILFDGKDITRASVAERRALQGDLRAVFQDPFSSLNPRRPIGDAHHRAAAGRAACRAPSATGASKEVLDAVGLAAGLRSALPAAVLGRPASAHRDRPGAGHRSAARGLRRGGQRARSLHAGAGAEPARRPACRRGPRLPLHRPRHGGRGVPRPARRRAQPWTDHGAGADGRGAAATRSITTPACSWPHRPFPIPTSRRVAARLWQELKADGAGAA